MKPLFGYQYQAMIYSQPTLGRLPIEVEVQLAVDAVNRSEDAIVEVIEDSGSGGANRYGNLVTAS